MVIGQEKNTDVQKQNLDNQDKIMHFFAKFTEIGSPEHIKQGLGFALE